MVDEQVTFDGIPIPLTMETILNAMCATYYSVSWPADLWDDEVAPENILKSRRQYRAFRERILRVDAEQEIALDAVTIHVGRLQKEILAKDASKKRVIDQLHAHELSHEFALGERDAKIAKLEIELNEAKNLDPTGEFHEPDW